MHNFYVRLAPALLPTIELLLVVAAGLLILHSHKRASNRQPSFFRRLESTFNRIAQRKVLAICAVGIGVIAARIALIPLLGIPEPKFHDEFSYLLAADTFAHGRVTNPTHPMWIHFETFHIIFQPTYMSMYPPAQGLVLAAGEVLGHPWIGQILVSAAMCSAFCWMLQGWFSPSWALLGAMLAALRLGMLSYWMNEYWCASIVALAGALVLGAWPRLRSRPSIGTSVVLAIGLVILANSRPYEGFIFSIPVAFAMLIWLIGRDHPPVKESLLRMILPIVVVLFLGALATGFYYYRVTGSPFELTYQVNRQQYAPAPYFVWQTPRPEPGYHNEVMRDYYRRELREFEQNRTLRGYIRNGIAKIAEWWQFYLSALMTVPLLALPGAMRRSPMPLPILICLAMMAAFAVQTWTFAHYFSPATGALYILLVAGLRHLWLWRGPVEGFGAAVVRAIPVIATAMILLRVLAVATGTHIEPEWPRGNLERAAVMRNLSQLPGGQLVIVRYGPNHDLNHEWVWNKALIDEAKVVWARDLGGDKNQELLHYFKNRRVWQINADNPSPKLEPYSPAVPLN